ncbi:sugar-binding protein [Dokdonia sinensis]|uniref:Sugar-binding protein n=1 Tax=Dokdonia sinensis TaxID=2479847 RepID=A0A3M0GHW9_9FLAO|nr:sugar-binding protein [Dokdonia sinensis]RMB64177.1 sugar-binding protein [Dokdonia sinensis]
MKHTLVASLLAISILSCKQENKQEAETSAVAETKTEVFAPKNDHQLRTIKKATIAPSVDGVGNDPAWEKEQWYDLDQRWLGSDYDEADFKGRYKMTWTPEALYILAEIQDDILYDQHKDPLTLWWDDDCLEIFIDEDNSGGGHQFTHNAFAYHVALDGNVVDIAPGEVPTLYNNHVRSKRKTTGNTTIWECAMTIYDDTYKDGGVNDQVVLTSGKKMGFALAYCDNDASKERENFIGSVPVPGEDKNRGWIDAGIFGTIELVE